MRRVDFDIRIAVDLDHDKKNLGGKKASKAVSILKKSFADKSQVGIYNLRSRKEITWEVRQSALAEGCFQHTYA